MKKTWIMIFLVLLLALSLGACDVLSQPEDTNGLIEGSGHIAARKVNVASELGGKIVEILVDEGDSVQVGDVLLKLDDEVYQAQYEQALAAVKVAQAAVDTAEAGVATAEAAVETAKAGVTRAKAGVDTAKNAPDAASAALSAAQINRDMALQGARIQEQPNRNAAWLIPQPDAYVLPGWYFEKDEEMAAVAAEIEAARTDLDMQLANLDKEIADASNADLIAAEARLVEARVTYTIAQQNLSQAQAAQANDTLVELAQGDVDAALSELEDAQLDYDQLLSTSVADDLLEARGQVALARARYENAQDLLLQFQTGEDALQVDAAEAAVAQAEVGVNQAETGIGEAEAAVTQAEAGVAQAEAGVTQAKVGLTQAQAGLEQAQAAVKLLEVQLKKTIIYAPVSGMVMARNLEVGEVVGAGSTALVIGELDEVELTVYIPEDQYGQVDLGQDATISVDSFPGDSFDGKVVRIAEEAEFTPRNVQTVDGRKSTVYAVVIRVPNADWKLKPGMPADAVMDTGG